MANSFGAITYIDSNPVADIAASGFGAAIDISAPYQAVFGFGVPFFIAAPQESLQSFGSEFDSSLPSFALGIIFMANLIQAADASNINVTTLTLSDKTGTGNMVIQSPAGAAYQFRGARLMTENRTTDYIIPVEKSGYVWTNTNAGAIAYTLPSGAPQGFAAYFVRTGGQVTITPSNTEKIEFGDLQNVKPSGAASTMSSSGSILGLVKDDTTRFVRFISFGTVS